MFCLLGSTSASCVLSCSPGIESIYSASRVSLPCRSSGGLHPEQFGKCQKTAAAHTGASVGRKNCDSRSMFPTSIPETAQSMPSTLVALLACLSSRVRLPANILELENIMHESHYDFNSPGLLLRCCCCCLLLLLPRCCHCCDCDCDYDGGDDD